jgi:hypothetical protein
VAQTKLAMDLVATTDALVAEVSETPRYPNGTVFLSSDPTALPSMLDAIREERAFVIVLPDRTEVACEPRMDPIARMRRRLWWPLFRWRAKTRPSFVIDKDGDGYDISPPDGFTLRLHHPMASPASCP